MTAAQIDMIKKSFEDYGYFVRVICDGGLEFVTSKETLVFDDANEVLYAIDINDDILGQQKWPARVLTAPYEIIFYIESIFTLDQLKKYMDEGSISSAITEEQKQAVIKNIQGLVNKFPRENFANASGYTPRVATVKSADGTTRNISTIKEAIETAKNGDNIRLYDTVVIGEEPITIPADTEITIDLNGNNVTAKNAAFTAPIDVPAAQSKYIFFCVRAFIAPASYAPFAPPPCKTNPLFILTSFYNSFQLYLLILLISMFQIIMNLIYL